MAQLQMAILAIAHGLAAEARDLFEAAAQAVASGPGSGFLADFVLSESGEVSPEQGFPVAWTGGLLVTAMVVLGSPPQAAAHCGGQYHYSGCSSDTECSHYCSHHMSSNCSGSCKGPSGTNVPQMHQNGATVVKGQHQDGEFRRPGVFTPIDIEPFPVTEDLPGN